MDEREEAAMRALSEGVRPAQENGTAGECMLVSIFQVTDISCMKAVFFYLFTIVIGNFLISNESYSKATHALLLKWLNARFPSSTNPASTSSLQNTPWDSYDHVRDAFLSVAG